jgi:serine/threonine-protein kinase
MSAESVAPASAWTPRVDEVVAGKYRVVRVVSVRRTSIVVDARHELLGRPAALAIVRASEATPEQVTRFVDHARAVAAIRSEHVASVLEVGALEDGSPFVAMDQLAGDDLGQLVEDRGPLAVEEAVDWMLQALEALAAAHAVGVVHRDLRPAELVITDGAAGPLLKVVDFPGPHERVSVSPYTAPELVRDPTARDPRCDVWAAGAVLYELLSGVPPFSAPGKDGLAAAILADAPRELSDLRWEEVPGQLSAVVMRCLQRDPHARFSDVDDLAVALAPFGSGAQARCVARAQTLLSQGPSTPRFTGVGSLSGQIVAAPAAPSPSPPATESVEPPRWPEVRDTQPLAAPAPRPYSPLTTSLSPASITAAPPPRSRVPLVLAAAALAGMVAGVAFWRTALRPAPAARPAVVAPPAPAPAPVPVPVPAPAPAPAPAPESAPASGSASASAPAPAATSSASAPRRPTKAQILDRRQ